MAPPVTLYRFQIELSDVDRGVYESLDVRAAQHPSEIPLYLVTRVLALALSWEDGLAFTPGGLSDPDEPALKSPDEHGGIQVWIDIGNPSARRLHKASKAARHVKVFTYKDPQILLAELSSEPVHRREEIEIYSLPSRFLDKLAERLDRTNSWQIIRNGESLMVTIGGETIEGEIHRHG